MPSDAPSAGGVTAGQLLCGALFSPDPTTSWLAATALSHSILNMKDNQEKLVRVQLAPGPNQPPTSLSAQDHFQTLHFGFPNIGPGLECFFGLEFV